MVSYIILKLNAFTYHEIKTITQAEMKNHFILQHDFPRIVKFAVLDIFIEGKAYYNPVLWTMKYELIGSFIVFILLPLVVRIRNELLIYLLYSIMLLAVTLTLEISYVAFILGKSGSDPHPTKVSSVNALKCILFGLRRCFFFGKGHLFCLVEIDKWRRAM
jgi:peptidoglycan/LPS O-acetylase OafA/YrhL